MNEPITEQQHTLSDATKRKILELKTHYPAGKSASAVLPALHLVQQDYGYLPVDTVPQVAVLLEMLVSEVEQVISFYRMYFTRPVGQYVVKVCDSISCYLRGSDELLEKGKEKLGIGLNETTPDGKVTLMKIECLAACSAAPCAQVNDEYVYNLTTEQFLELLDELKRVEENPYYVP
jgi:NADH-quinone oxidoreductase subunit E